MRRLALLLVLLGLIAAAVWLPREEDVAADTPESVAVAEVPPAVEFRAVRGTASAPFAERWELGFPDATTPAQTLTLQIGAIAGTTATGRLTATPGNPASLLDRLAVVMSTGATPAPDLPPAAALALRLDLLGEHLSAGYAEVGATVIAGAFSATPAGDWRAYRLTLGEGGPQCFFGLSEGSRAAVFLPRAIEEGPAIVAQFRALLPHQARRES